MKAILSMVRDLHKDESGTSFIEYTVLLGVVLSVTVAVITTMGSAAGEVWGNLTASLRTLAGLGSS
jgi:Flp pilus assembly pilin Flp